jgi:hypothetical protein
LSRRVVGLPPSVGGVAPRGAGAQALLRCAEAVVLVALLALAVIARRPSYLLSHSFWLDEGWVIDSVRAPLRQLGLLTSSTPVGWTLLLRAVPPLGGPQRYRLLPLAFGVATVPLAWILARRLGRWGVVRAAVAAISLTLLPPSLARHDLKQYSAEGFVAVAVLLLVAWVEERWSRRRLALLALLGAGSILIANAAPLVVLAGLGALVLTAAARRQWRPAGEAAAAAQRYPFLEARTSLFVAATLAVYAALGIGELIVLLLARAWTAPLAIGTAACAAALLLSAAQRAALEPMPSADVREQLAVVRANWRAGDAVIVNSGGTFPFAYYCPSGRPSSASPSRPPSISWSPTPTTPTW